jgi:hypothetical protein
MADNWQTTFITKDGRLFKGEFKDGNIVKKGNN